MHPSVKGHWLRSAVSIRRTLLALVALLSIAGYLVTSETIRRDRDSAAARRAEEDSARTQEVLGRARALVVGLGSLLAAERREERRFAQLAGGITTGVGLVDAMWVERVPGSERTAYERRRGHPITRLTPAGTLEPAPRAASYLVATFTTTTLAALRPGVDVSGWSALAAGIDNASSAFAVTASEVGSLAGRTGFFLLQAGSYGRGVGSRGDLVLFAPRGWLTALLQADASLWAISIDDRRLEGRLRSLPAAGASFSTLGRRWRIAVGLEPATGLQALLPWLALAWPSAAALVAFLVGRGISRRRGVERELERVFTLSLDLLCVAGFDGYLKRVNPAWERTFGFTEQELLSRPFLDFVHPEDRARTEAVVAGSLAEGEELVEFENRHLCRDGSARWLQWTSRPVLEQGLTYAVARDVTDRKRGEAGQAALRRVATLVARAVEPTEVFAAVARELRGLLDADATRIERQEPDGTITVIASEGQPFDELPAKVHAAITVEGRTWGVTVAAWRHPGQIDPGTEGRIARFTDLVATAIANAESRAQLTASRARAVTAADETRRRIERALHDSTQQRLVGLGLQVRSAEAMVPPELAALQAQLTEISSNTRGVLDELREISRGLHPPILRQGGLGPALNALARRTALPVEVDVRMNGRLPERLEAASYYIVSEAVTNAVKHANASVVRVRVDVRDGTMALAISDDGTGGADPQAGTGLLGLADRVDVLRGKLRLDSPPGHGTTLHVTLPLDCA